MCVCNPHGCQYTVRPDCDSVTRNVPIEGNFFAPLRTMTLFEKGRTCWCKYNGDIRNDKITWPLFWVLTLVWVA